MGRHDWYRNKHWNEDVESAFEAKFARTRQPWSRWQYLTIQAGMIARQHPAVAMSLYRRSVELGGVQPDWASMSYLRMGQLALENNERSNAIELLRTATTICPREERGILTSKTPEQLLTQLLWFDEDPEVRAEAKTYLTNPAGSPEWGEIPEVPCDPGGYPYATAEDAAESLVIAFHVTDAFDPDLVDALFAAEPRVLSAFDNMLLTQNLFSIFRPWSDHGRWELPAFIGRCLVRNADAEWVEADHIKGWRLELKGEEYELYPHVWHELHRGVPIRGIYEALAA